ncbi:NfeD family protein [Naumannella huperziae]
MVVAFMVAGGIGVAVLVLSLVLGDVFDGLGGALDDVGGDFFSVGGVAGAVAVFGFGAAALLLLGAPTPWAVVGGIALGIVLGAGVGWLTNKLKSAEGDTSTVRRESMIGAQGRVIADIPDDGFGIVTVTVNGHLTRLNARADAALPSGTNVRVSEVLTATSAKVVPTSPEDPLD